MSAPSSAAPPRPRRPRPGSASAAPPPSKTGERLAKRIARAGLCSRREAEAWIRAGRVAVDGRVVESPALDVTNEQRITVDGRPLPEPEPTRLFRWHKPRGVVTSARDPEGRPTYVERLPPGLPRLMPIGRLDIDSEGLLLLTNDGELKRRLELPTTGWTRRYRVRAFGTVDEAALARLRDGLTVNGIAYGPVEARLDKVQGANVWLTVALKEGKNREVRRVLEHLGLKVNRLIRIAYGPFQLGNLAKNAIEEVPRKVLREQLGTAALERGGRRRSVSPGAGRTPAP
jgi:23S rRNA pseudouridine2605 synthase